MDEDMEFEEMEEDVEFGCRPFGVS